MFVIKKAKNGQFYFNLLAKNKEIILTSEMYTSKASCKNGIESVKKNASDPGQFEARVNKKGKDYFVLKAKNHQVIGNSEAYNSKAGMKNGIKSVGKNAPGAKVEDKS